MVVFIIGPGGVGKSTAGKILADKMGLSFVDLDIAFIDRLGKINYFINKYGYKEYCYKNSELFYDLLKKYSKNTVFALSSGFLVHKGLNALTEGHYKTIKSVGKSILLLPSKIKKEAIDIVVKRQMRRGLELNEKDERRKITLRYSEYLSFGDIKIFSNEKPEVIADMMMKALMV